MDIRRAYAMAALLVLGTFMLLPSTGSADSGQASLRGVKAICADVDIDRQAQRNGLQRSRMQQLVEARLARAGITVIPQAEGSATSGTECLKIFINTHTFSGWRDMGLCAFSVYSQFMQPIVLVRDASTKGMGSTWSINFTGMVGKKSLNRIEEKVIEIVDEFIKDYSTANSK